VDAVGARVAGRLAESGGATRARPVLRWLAAAAGVVLIAGAGFLTFGTEGIPPAAGHPVGLTPSLLDLSTSELRMMLDSLEEPALTYVFSDPSLDDLDTEQLATLLSLMEG
jgi:hypothetical protein